MINHGMFSYAFLKDAITNFRGWIDELLATSWEAGQGSDVIIEAPSAMGGIHIAEALGIPYFRAMTMPWTRTRAYPDAFLTPDIKKGGSYNYMTYVLFDNLFWKGISSQVNKWRKVSLGLEKTNRTRMSQTKIPFMYNVSPSVLVPPVDFSDWIHVTGYWFLDEGNEEFEPRKELVEFIEKARADNKKIVYIGFGSIVVPKPAELTKAVIKSVQAAGVRCVLSKGWSDRSWRQGQHSTRSRVAFRHLSNQGCTPRLALPKTRRSSPSWRIWNNWCKSGGQACRPSLSHSLVTKYSTAAVWRIWE